MPLESTVMLGSVLIVYRQDSVEQAATSRPEDTYLKTKNLTPASLLALTTLVPCTTSDSGVKGSVTCAHSLEHLARVNCDRATYQKDTFSARDRLLYGLLVAQVSFSDLAAELCQIPRRLRFCVARHRTGLEDAVLE